MIVWGEERRRCDPGFFCRAAIEDALSEFAEVDALTEHAEVDAFTEHTQLTDATPLEQPSKTAQTSTSQVDLSLLTSTSSTATTPPSVTTASLHSRVWIISDARRLTDLQFFRKNYPDVLVCLHVL